MTRIFVYGTLRQGYWNWDRFLKDRSVSRGLAKTNAKFVMCIGGSIPWIVPDEANGVNIVGEVFDVEDPRVAAAIDRLEGGYQRTVGLVTLASGAVVKAVYYQSERENLYGGYGGGGTVPSGDYTMAVPKPTHG